MGTSAPTVTASHPSDVMRIELIMTAFPTLMRGSLLVWTSIIAVYTRGFQAGLQLWMKPWMMIFAYSWQLLILNEISSLLIPNEATLTYYLLLVKVRIAFHTFHEHRTFHIMTRSGPTKNENHKWDETWVSCPVTVWVESYKCPTYDSQKMIRVRFSLSFPHKITQFPSWDKTLHVYMIRSWGGW